MARYGVTFTKVVECYIELEAENLKEIDRKIISMDYNKKDEVPLCMYNDIVEINEI